MRKAGILMHISCLPSNYGIGTIGGEAFKFVDFLKKTGQKYWQILPLNPTDFNNSPYQSPSVFAGNPLLIDIDELKKDGFLKDWDTDGIYFGSNPEQVDFDAVKGYKKELLKKTLGSFQKSYEYMMFETQNSGWLNDYSLFMALKDYYDGKPWYDWDEDIRKHTKKAIEKYTNELWESIEYYRLEQFLFYTQWAKLKNYANENGIEIIGDVPIYVALDSADVWANSNLFLLDEDYVPKAIAGCPPDLFSKDGQKWGNPLYDWKTIKKTGYLWWINRIKETRKLYDVVRLDHFRGFEAYYSIPYDAETAREGKWQKGPGKEFFDVIKKHVPDAKIIAEDLGYLTPEVYELLEDCGFPGMKVLQFAFDPYRDNPYLPYNYPKNCVAYTGTHDNDTLINWYRAENNKPFIRDYLNVAEDEWVPAAMIRTILASRADTVIIPIQDYLGYGRRMNTPGTVGPENWSYRIRGDALNDNLAYHVEHLTRLYKRDIKE
ncbi:MAG: 4-alpha-glucanotransferase [Clostridia bacterium]|nr:4-alpha-glucanotransferase [Clostridia bacterium]